jgi:hypothetical protein
MTIRSGLLVYAFTSLYRSFSILFNACADNAQTVLARIACTVIHDIGQYGKASCFPNDSTVREEPEKKLL